MSKVIKPKLKTPKEKDRHGLQTSKIGIDLRDSTTTGEPAVEGGATINVVMLREDGKIIVVVTNTPINLLDSDLASK
jgi:hypothetical protein